MQTLTNVTPSDTVDLPGGPALWLWAGVTGNINIAAGPQQQGGAIQTAVLQAVPAGTWIKMPLWVTRIMSTSTTATGIVVASGTL